MKQLLKKEFTLAAHPTNYIFLALSALILVPNYPYYVTFFYTGLGIFFMCLSGRENRDLEYSLILPVGKADIVSARLLFCGMLEAAQLILACLFAALRSRLRMEPNIVGMEPNAAFFGISLIMLAIFNHIFFSIYFSDPRKVGKAFVHSSIAVFIFICAAEASAHAVPFVRDVLDTQFPAYPVQKLAVFAVGLIVYVIWGILLHKKCRRTFVSIDL